MGSASSAGQTNSDGLVLKSTDGQFGLTIRCELISQLLTFCKESAQKETGGILVGRYSTDNLCATLTQIEGPAVDSLGKSMSFFRGIKGMNSMLKKLWKAPKRSHYLGEWHFHPGGAGDPSIPDEAQMVTISTSNYYGCPEPILIIIGGSYAKLKINAFVFPRGSNRVDLE